MVSWHREFPDHADLGVSVNVSPVQLTDRGFPKQVAAILRASGLAPNLLTWEITEGVLVSSAESIEALRGLKSLGVRIAIDDFGTGYSSLAYLRTLDVDVLKIDKSFHRSHRDGARCSRPSRKHHQHGDKPALAHRGRRHRGQGPDGTACCRRNARPQGFFLAKPAQRRGSDRHAQETRGRAGNAANSN